MHQVPQSKNWGIMLKMPRGNNTVSDQMVALAKVDQLYRTARTTVRTIGVVSGVWLFAQALAPFAGKETAVSLVLNVLADFKFALTVTLAGAAAAWAVAERRLRERKTKYLQDRVKELETKIDHNRSSSGLTRTGKTNPRARRP
jgi:hypothetical protein